VWWHARAGGEHLFKQLSWREPRLTESALDTGHSGHTAVMVICVSDRSFKVLIRELCPAAPGLKRHEVRPIRSNSTDAARSSCISRLQTEAGG
jgi:hypothetical protein